MKKNKKLIALIASLVFSVVFSVLFKWGQTGNPFKSETIMYGAIFFLNILITGSIGYVVFKVYSQKSSAQLKKRILPLFLFFVLGALLISLAIVSIGNYVLYLVEGLRTTDFMKHLFQVELPEAVKQFSIWILIISVFLFYILWRQTINREQQLREENLKYQYRTLKAHVNPHFLFNSLNTLSEIVYVDAKKADNYIQKLSGIYRYILDNEEVDLIPLNKDIEFVRQYFDLQKERDENKIQLEINVENADKFKIMPMSLQILVENALKHNAVSEGKPLEIYIYGGNGYIMVSNNIQRRSILNSSPGTGLSNLKDRVKLITGKEITVSQENNHFLVRLPIINIEE